MVGTSPKGCVLRSPDGLSSPFTSTTDANRWSVVNPEMTPDKRYTFR